MIATHNSLFHRIWYQTTIMLLWWEWEIRKWEREISKWRKTRTHNRKKAEKLYKMGILKIRGWLTPHLFSESRAATRTHRSVVTTGAGRLTWDYGEIHGWGSHFSHPISISHILDWFYWPLHWLLSRPAHSTSGAQPKVDFNIGLLQLILSYHIISWR